MKKKYLKSQFNMKEMINYGLRQQKRTDEQMRNLKIAQETFGAKTLSQEQLGLMRLTPKNVIIAQKNAYREGKIISGDYLDKRNKQYLNNYIDALSKLGVSDTTLNRLRDKMGKNGFDFMISTALPPLKDWYIYLKRGRDKRGRFIDINEQTDIIEEQVNTALDDLEDLGYV